MSWFNRRPKAPEAVAAEETPAFNVDKALNNKKFLEFLTKYDDAEDLNLDEEASTEDIEAIKVRYEAFESMSSLSRSLKGLYKGEIADKLGVKLGDKEVEDVDAYLETLVLEDPEQIADLTAEFERQAQLRVDTVARQQELRTIKRELGAYAENENELELAAKTAGFFNKKNAFVFGWFFRTKAENQARKAMIEEYGSLKEAKQHFDQMIELQASVEEVEEAMARFKEEADNGRLWVLENLEVTEGLVNKAKEQAQEDLKKLAEGTDLKDLDKAVEIFDRLAAGDSDSFENLTEGLEADFGSKLDQAVHEKVSAEMIQAVNGLPDSLALSSLEKVLKKFIDRESVGLDKGDDAKEFIRSTLEGIIYTPGLSSAKTILLKRLHVKLKNS